MGAPTFLETHEQDQVIRNFSVRIERQQIFWKRFFGLMSVMLSLGVVYSYLADATWYPSLLDRTTYGHTPSAGVAKSITIIFSSSILATGFTFFSSHVKRDSIIIVVANIIASIIIAISSHSMSYTLLLSMAYQIICNVALHTIHEADGDLQTLKKYKYNYKTA
jgi:hypothetical protein